MAITYSTFEDYAKKNGVFDSFSDADKDYAKQNPDWGLQMATYKTQYMNAKTDEERALIHSQAEASRKSVGNYSGGTDGSSFTLLGSTNTATTPTSFTDGTKSNWTQNSGYTDAVNNQLNTVLNYKDFSYDPNTDPLYSAYKQNYLREADRQTDDTLGTYAANTGGLASSYAVTAAQQAGNYQRSQLNDKLPDLYTTAYNQYTQGLENEINKYNMLVQADELERSRYNDEQSAQASALASQQENELAWAKVQNDNEQNALDRENSYKIAQLNNEYDYNIAALKQNATTDGYNGSLTTGEYNDLKGSYPDGNVPLDKWDTLREKYSEETLKSAGFNPSITSGIDTSTTTSYYNSIHDLLAYTGIKLKPKVYTQEEFTKNQKIYADQDEFTKDYQYYLDCRLADIVEKYNQ